MSKIARKFDQLALKNEKAFIAFVMAGDPDLETSFQVIESLPAAGVDIIEIGMPFTDPMADGPTIQLAGQRALNAGMTIEKTLKMVERFRQKDGETPIVLMGYYNPIYTMGVENFLAKAREVGVDGLIVVDLPPEEDDELCVPSHSQGIDFIRLTTPTTDDDRLKQVARNTSGFVYYVSILGITGAASANAENVRPEVKRIKAATQLPVCVGFGVKTPENAREIAKVADGVVVGSAIVDKIAAKESLESIVGFVEDLSKATKAR